MEIIRLNKRINIKLVFIVFCYLFRFIVFKGTILESVLDSSSIVFLFLVMIALLDKRYFNQVIKVFRSWYMHKILIMYFMIFMVIILIFIKEALFTYVDIGFLKTWILVGIQIIIGVFVYSYIKNEKGDVLRILIMAFILQACIQLFSFAFPIIWEILNCFRTESVILKSGSIRGMSLDRYDYFNLACGYSMLYIILVFRWNKWKESTFWRKILGLALLIYGGLASARTSMVAMLFSIGAYFIKKHYQKKEKIKLKYLCYTLCFIVTLLFLMNYAIEHYEPAKRMFDFLFIHIINFVSKGEYTNPSTRQLFGEMYFAIEPSAWLFGEGHYLNENGGYYRNTDAGYMRMILYGGVFISLLLFSFQLLFIDVKKSNKIDKLEKIFIVGLLLILNIKGIVIGCQQLILSMIILIYLSDKDRNIVEIIVDKGTL